MTELKTDRQIVNYIANKIWSADVDDEVDIKDCIQEALNLKSRQYEEIKRLVKLIKNNEWEFEENVISTNYAQEPCPKCGKPKTKESFTCRECYKNTNSALNIHPKGKDSQSGELIKSKPLSNEAEREAKVVSEDSSQTIYDDEFDAPGSEEYGGRR